MYASDAVTIDGETFTHKTSETTYSHRKTCVICKTPVCNDHSDTPMAMIDIPGSVLNVKFEPTMHFHYAERILDMKDGLPKYKDFPSTFGGSDIMINEKTGEEIAPGATKR